MRTKVTISKAPFGAYCRFGELVVGDHFLYEDKLHVRIPATSLTNCMAVESGRTSFILSEATIEAVDVSFSIWRKEKLDEN